VPQLRFAACLPDGTASSEPWRVWTHGGEAYVAVRRLGGMFKASLHASGNWRNGHTSDYIRRKRSEGLGEHDFVVRRSGAPERPQVPERLHDQWRRPEPIWNGLTDAMRLIVPAASCTLPPEPSTKRKPIEYIAVPRAMMLTFSIVIAPRHAFPPGVNFVPFCHVGSLPLGDDETLWVLANVEPLDQLVMEAATEDDTKFTDDELAFFVEDVSARMTSSGFYSDFNGVQTPWILDLDPFVALVCRLKYMQDHDYPANDVARIEAFAKAFHRRREAALAELRNA
jgi:hypothetical protein